MLYSSAWPGSQLRMAIAIASDAARLLQQQGGYRNGTFTSEGVRAPAIKRI
jgi:hypothetical protein